MSAFNLTIWHEEWGTLGGGRGRERKGELRAGIPITFRMFHWTECYHHCGKAEISLLQLA